MPRVPCTVMIYNPIIDCFVLFSYVVFSLDFCKAAFIEFNGMLIVFDSFSLSGIKLMKGL